MNQNNINGFLKRADDYGLNQDQAFELLKQALPWGAIEQMAAKGGKGLMSQMSHTNLGIGSMKNIANGSLTGGVQGIASPNGLPITMGAASGLGSMGGAALSGQNPLQGLMPHQSPLVGPMQNAASSLYGRMNPVPNGMGPNSINPQFKNPGMQLR